MENILPLVCLKICQPSQSCHFKNCIIMMYEINNAQTILTLLPKLAHIAK